MSLGPQVTMIPLELARGHAWRLGLFFTPCVSFWEEGGICDRVTWCLGLFSLVSIFSSLSCPFLSFSIQISAFPPPFCVLSARTRKVTIPASPCLIVCPGYSFRSVFRQCVKNLHKLNEQVRLDQVNEDILSHLPICIRGGRTFILNKLPKIGQLIVNIVPKLPFFVCPQCFTSLV